MMGKEPTQRRTVVLTGASGFLGSRLLERLQKDRSYGKIIILDVQPPDALTRKCKFYQMDLTEPGIDRTIADVLTHEQGEIIAHLAFHSSPRRDERTSHELTVIGTLNVLKACARAGAARKLVVQSTTLVYGASHLNPSLLDEDHALNGAGAYSFIRDKVEVERMVKKFAKNRPETTVTVLRFCPVLSRHHADYITEFLQRSVVLTALGYDPLVQFIHEEDVLAALKRAVDVDAPGAFNIVGQGVLYLSTILKLAGKTAVPVLHPLAYPLVDAMWYLQMSETPGAHLDYLRYSCIADGARAEQVLKFSPKHSTKETLLEYLSRS
jgi:UDP-glucose 4-epimerase